MDVRYSGGTQYSASSTADCLQRCISASTCLAADYRSTTGDCYIHTNTGDLTRTVSAVGYWQYLLLRRCDEGTDQAAFDNSDTPFTR